MEREYRTVDKSSWKRGPWDDEPDKAQWKDEATGLPCLLVRNSSGGNLCGYVGVAEGHPLFGKSYDDVRLPNNDGEDDYPDVHGGLTFADRCHPHPDGEARGICHIPDEGEPDHVWWFGFDCAHSWDYSPAYSARPEPCFRRTHDETYKCVAYVKNECRKLAQQLARIQPDGQG